MYKLLRGCFLRQMLFVLWLVLAGTVAASGIERGARAYDAGDYATALKEWQPLADQGDPTAQFIIGVMYANGQGVEKNPATAVAYYEKAAQQGYSVAQYNLGIAYAMGQGVVKDHAKAAEYWQNAAEQGFTQAQYNLGSLYYYGLGVKEDWIEARKWYELAAANGSEEAKQALHGMRGEQQLAEATSEPDRSDVPTPYQPTAGTRKNKPVSESDEQWLLSRPSRRYTIQIYLHDNEAAVLAYINKHDLQNRAAYHRKFVDGKLLYAVVYGDYEESSAAMDAIQELPDAIQRHKPWVRSYAQVHTAIRRARGEFAASAPPTPPSVTAPVPAPVTDESE